MGFYHETFKSGSIRSNRSLAVPGWRRSNNGAAAVIITAAAIVPARIPR